ncbi:hypothetical protein [Pseudomonas sp. 2023EL-01195]|uniref:hypothetical protein n=1 Tax=Pseudomonas sp. 2023EL-01195 TaxID=3088134 RepID=UPI00296AAD93|nr:hypothetical protein [Pseudomonas sp. 2023EL-01195]MDW3712919.1 hypothetical protein [Pseudomonas sp. 2023EL-01195]
MTLSKPRQNCSRDQVLIAHAQEQIARTSFSTDHFAHALNTILLETMGDQVDAKKVPDLRDTSIDGAKYMRDAANWLKRVQRWLDRSVDFPAWLEEAWVEALEPEYRERCLQELASRYGLLAVRELGGDACPVTAFGQLVTRMGSTVEACGHVLADGLIDERDLPNLPAMIEALLAAESRCCQLRRAAENVLGSKQPALRSVP